MVEKILGNCWQCGTDLGAGDYGRETQCLACGKPTRVCRNCRWFDPGYADQCKEPMAEAVQEKERANFCDFFEPRLQTGSGAEDSGNALRRAAEELFR